MAVNNGFLIRSPSGHAAFILVGNQILVTNLDGKPFWSPFGSQSHLGHHQVAEAIWSPFGHGTCVHLKGERKCHDQMATKLPGRPNGVLNCSKQPNGDQNEPFWTPLGHHGHLGHHQVAIWSPREFGHGTCVHLNQLTQYLLP